MARVSSWPAVALAFALLAGLLSAGVPAPARADTLPTSPGEPASVAADPLPTVQIDGVVWSQVVLGNTVYAGGNFASARPAGAEPGVDEVTRTSLLAYDIRTGKLDPTFAPVFDGQVLALALSPDGSRLYVGGQFTKVNGFTRSRLAVFDTKTGALLKSFIPIVGTTVRSLAATADTVYLGGDFLTINAQPRPYLGAVSAADGSTLAWAPEADDQVTSLVMNPSGSKLVVGGRFFNVGGAEAVGLAALDPTTAQQVPWAVNQTIKNAGPFASITSLSTDGESVFGTGYTYALGADAVNGFKGNFEGAFRVDGETGAIVWLADCYGDHYSVWPGADAVYTSSHAHSCSNVVGGFGDTNPRSYFSSEAFSKDVRGVLTYNPLYSDKFPTSYAGTASPELLHWYPIWSVGAFTGQYQAGWNVSGNDDYVLYGGEFVAVNGKAQQGLVRFARRDIAPNRVAPQRTDGLQPEAVSVARGRVDLGWQATFDRDNRAVTYRIYRNNTAVTDTPIYSTTVQSTPWQRPTITYVDSGLPAGSTQTYRIFAFDAFGNTIGSAETSVVVAGAGSTYGRAVIGSDPEHWYRMDDADGSRLADNRGSATAFSPALLVDGGTSGITAGEAGATGDGSSAILLDGTDDSYAVGDVFQMGPQVFSVEAWVKTTTTTGGRILGFGDTQLSPSRKGWTDRNLYLSNSGQVYFGVKPGDARKTVNSTVAVNDGQWHHLVGTFGPSGLALYVDGALAATDPTATQARQMMGIWKVGVDGLDNWPKAPSTFALKGAVDDVAVYHRVLTADEVAAHFAAADGVEPPPLPGGNQNSAPSASFGSSSIGLAASFNATASSDPDGSIVSYAWNFGDGSPVQSTSEPTTAHNYPAYGNYLVRLTVKDNRGATDSLVRTIAITEAPVVPPTAAFTVTVKDNLASVDAANSFDPDGSIAAYSWDFGDGSSATGKTAQHTYAKAGGFTITLTVTDNDGASATTSKSVTAVLPNMLPTASYIYGAEGLRLTFDGTGSSDPDGTIVGYTWKFGDGSAFGSGPTVTHDFKPGEWPVTLIVKDNRGGTASTVTKIKVSKDITTPMPTPTPTPPPATATGYTAMTPLRLADTRDSGARIPANGVLKVKVAGKGSVPADASAAALNVTVTGPTGAGWVVAYPCGTTAPLASNLNFVAGQTVPNAVLAGIGSSGEVCFKASAATHLVVDANGWFPAGG